MTSRLLQRFRALVCGLAVVLLAAAPASGEVVYPEVRPGVAIDFPADEGAHPDFRTEWWYVTGWLRSAAGPPVGFQVTFFRVRPGLGESNPSAFAPRQILFGHAAIADPGRGRLQHGQRSARTGFGLAYARDGRVDVRIDDWSLVQDGDRYHAAVAGDDFALRLDLERTQPPLLQGDRGFSRKGPGADAASYYYSLPQLRVSGDLVIDGRRESVEGDAWFDHEWSSKVMDESARGWEWIGINLDDGGALMAFRMRDAEGASRWSAATLRTAAGGRSTFGTADVTWRALRRWKSPRTGAEYPVEWQLQVGESTYRIRPLMGDAELDSRGSTGTIYWEGPVELTSPEGEGLGHGYLELTGYAGELDL